MLEQLYHVNLALHKWQEIDRAKFERFKTLQHGEVQLKPGDIIDSVVDMLLQQDGETTANQGIIKMGLWIPYSQTAFGMIHPFKGMGLNERQ